MFPNIFIEDAFFDVLESHFYKENMSGLGIEDATDFSRTSSLKRILDLFLSSNIYCDLKDRDILKYYKKPTGSYSTIRDVVFNRIIKDSSFGRTLFLDKQRLNCSTSEFSFFTSDDYDQCCANERQSGMIHFGQKLLDRPFFLKSSFGTELTDSTLSKLSSNIHPCRSIIIFDRYLFNDSDNRERKIPNLIEFLRSMISSELASKFEIDIITENGENNYLFNNKYHEILSGLNNEVSLHLYAPKKLTIRDRYILTNYAIVSVGHPFDGDTHISCSFYPSNSDQTAIKNAYKAWLQTIILIKKNIQVTPETFGKLKCVWKSDNISHSIFDVKALD